MISNNESQQPGAPYWSSADHYVWRDDSRFAHESVDAFPKEIADHILAAYKKRWNDSLKKHGQTRSANVWLRRVCEKVTAAARTIPVSPSRISNDKVREETARMMADECLLLISDEKNCTSIEAVHARAMQVARRWHFSPSINAVAPVQDVGESDDAFAVRAQRELMVAEIERLISDQWWIRKITIVFKRFCEHCQIIFGKVRKGVSPYLSAAACSAFRQQKEANRRAMENLMLRNDETGDEIELLQAVRSSVSNPALRRHELMVRMRGFEDLAKEKGLVGCFFTVTCPSKFHAFKTDRKTGKTYPNKNFAGGTPRDAQRHLCKAWARVRAWLNRKGIDVMGFRVCEPHHDATPHWHALLFFAPGHEHLVQWAFANYFTEEDREELGIDDQEMQASIACMNQWHSVAKAAKARCDFVKIDESKGSATAYIAKYIAKNIDGHAVGVDEESGLAANDGAQSVAGWASMWGIRQFQQIGGAPVTIWRELRRLETADEKATRLDAKNAQRHYSLEIAAWSEIQKNSSTIEAARRAACLNRWDMYQEAMGGAFAKRAERPIKLMMITKPNINGERVEKLAGLKSLFEQVTTRTDSWKIVKKTRDSGSSSASSSSSAFEQGDSRAAWSSNNNCTEHLNDHDFSAKKEQLLQHLKRAGFKLDSYDITSLLKHGVLRFKDYRLRFGFNGMFWFFDVQEEIGV